MLDIASVLRVLPLKDTHRECFCFAHDCDMAMENYALSIEDLGSAYNWDLWVRACVRVLLNILVDFPSNAIIVNLPNFC